MIRVRLPHHAELLIRALTADELRELLGQTAEALCGYSVDSARHVLIARNILQEMLGLPPDELPVVVPPAAE